MDRDSILHRWLQEIENIHTDTWEQIPDIGLYMDQVTGYLGERLSALSPADEPILTSSMVNNYVKLGYLDRPEKKRYARAHLATLYLLCSMKRTLSIPEASFLISALSEEREEGLAKVYAEVTATQARISAELAENIPTCSEREELLSTALSLTLRAEAMRLVAERMIALVAEDEKSGADAKEEAQREVERLAAVEEKRAAKAAAKAAKAAR